MRPRTNIDRRAQTCFRMNQTLNMSLRKIHTINEEFSLGNRKIAPKIIQVPDASLINTHSTRQTRECVRQ